MLSPNKNRGDGWLSNLDQKIAENSKLSLFLILQVVIIALLIIGYMKMINKLEVNIELPSTIEESGKIIVGKDYANGLFFKMWARQDVETISDFNQKSIFKKIDYLKNRMYPPAWYKYQSVFKTYEKKIAKNLISQKFTFAKENINVKTTSSGNAATVNIPGFFSKSIDGDIVTKAKKCSYELGYIIQGGHIYVDSIKTNCK